MKTRKLSLRFLTVLFCCLGAAGIAAAQDVTVSGKEDVPSRSYDLTAEIGPHHRIWRDAAPVRNADGDLVVKPSSYTELEVGMHYKENGFWKETQEIIEIVGNGAEARQGPHKVKFAPNINSRAAIDLETPDGKRLRSHVLGLSYFDAITGASVLIAEIRDAAGVLVAPNVLVYKNAFDGVQADIRYTYTKGGLEQDVLLLESPPSPADFGMDPEATRLEVLTEFIDPPLPEKDLVILKEERDPIRRSTMFEPDFVDETLHFGSMHMGPGAAFSNPQGEAGPVQRNAPATGKAWRRLEGRDFLIEAVPYSAIKPVIDKLPRAAVGGQGRHAQLSRQLPLIATVKSPVDEISMATTSYAPKALVIDYIIVSGFEAITFQSGVTYYLAGYVSFTYGTATFESGAIIKSSSTGELHIGPNYAINCPAGAGPVIFTSKDDNSVGETIPGSTGNPVKPTGGGYVLSTRPPSATTFENLEFRYASGGLVVYSPEHYQETVRNCRFRSVGTGVWSQECYFLYLQNLVMCDVTTPYSGSWIQATNVITDCTGGGGGVIPVAEAVEAWQLPWSSGGATNWSGVNAGAFYGGDCAKSPALLDGQSSYLEATLQGPAFLAFEWKVSSEANYDFLRFYRDGVLQAQISGDANWSHRSVAIDPGLHTVRWEYVKDGSVSYGSDAGWVDAVQIYGTGLWDIGIAVQNTRLPWRTGGNNVWYSYSGWYAQSAGIGNNESTYMETSVVGPGTLSYVWWVSSESYDFLSLKIDGFGVARISGSQGSAVVRKEIGPGPHTVRWEYRKDGSVAQGNDAGYLDAVVYSGDRDADGISDLWEREYFGDLLQGGSGDPDGDGCTNLQEYQNGTHPMIFGRSYVEVFKGSMALAVSGLESGSLSSVIDGAAATGCTLQSSGTRWLRVDTGGSYPIGMVRYSPPEYAPNYQSVTQYEIYVTQNASTNLADWGSAVASGVWTWPVGVETKSIEFAPVIGRYVIFRFLQPSSPTVNEIWVYRTGTPPGSSVDSDADGLPDYWETFFFGNLSQSGSGDWDQDGLSNSFELQSGSNPNQGQTFQLYTPLKN